jgi:hypothetical protein
MTNTKKNQDANRKAQKKNGKQIVVKAARSLVPSQRPSRPLTNGRPAFGRMDLPAFTVASCSPFSRGALGAKVPDDNELFTSTAFTKYRVKLTTNSSGTVAAAFRYHVGSNFSSPNYDSTTNSTLSAWNAATAASSSSINSLALAYSGVRTVGWGIRITTPLNYTNAAGYVHVCTLGDVYFAGTSYDLPIGTSANIISTMETAPSYQCISISDLVNNDVLVTPRRTDMTGYRYYVPNVSDQQVGLSTPNPFPTSGWQQVMIYIEAGPATSNAITVEMITHLECIPLSSSLGYAPDGLAVAPHDPVTLNATTAVARKVSSITVAPSGADIMDAPGFANKLIKEFNVGALAATGLDLVTGNFASAAKRVATSAFRIMS